MSEPTQLVPSERIERKIRTVRGQKVLLDSDLAALYGVATKRLNERVKRNKDRFPADFVFQLTKDEWEALRSQIATSKGRGGRRVPPYAFTEHGALMAASILNTPIAIQVSVQVVRTFIRLRQLLASNSALAQKLEALERKYDAKFRIVFDAIRQLLAPPKKPPKPPIGFRKG